MKKLVSIVALSVALISCQETTNTSKAEFKTGYIDSGVLLKDYEKFKDENEKFKVKAEEMGRPIEAKERQLQAEKDAFQRNAQANGQAWAQQKYAELQQRSQQVAQEKNEAYGKIDQEAAKLQDTLIKQVKKYIKDYGKKEKFDYIFTTSDDMPTVIYAKDSYNLTDKLLKELNEQYKVTKEKK
jgi:outer membrane protein